MKLYLLSNPHKPIRYQNFCYRAIVAAPDEATARAIHPDASPGFDPWTKSCDALYDMWAKTPADVIVSYLGEAAPDVLAGVIMADCIGAL